MATYRVYFLDDGAHISRPPIILECADDDEAARKARQYIDGKDIEVWRGDYLVTKFRKK